ncbi:recombinase family protein [Amygdalobacter indicium]|uniref:Recombinase family protein n=1 Tax=Amygdalobacter indicium TaxID=3029272 RepID=A0ABY8C673_9FIRM|nr:recombinase family protein [Amygdalobacter indicium]WEG36207.1 recombinase family protein [Amygdalobacter indicium]
MYREYLEGLSLRDIAEGLEKYGIKNGAGHLKWHLSNIKTILVVRRTKKGEFIPASTLYPA